MKKRKSLGGSSGLSQPLKQIKAPCPIQSPAYAVVIAVDPIFNGYPLTLTKAGGRDYGVIRGAIGTTCTVRATTFPNNAPNELALVTWPDGSTGETFVVPRDVAASTLVTATYRGANDALTLWVIWATITIDVANNVPARSGLNFSHAVAGSITTNPGVLGVQHQGVGGAITATGRICATGVLQPVNLHTVMQDGRLRIRRYFDEDTYTDGVLVETARVKKDDTVNAHFNQLSINDHEEIFDLDAPTFAIYGHMDFASETYMSFTQWVEFGTGAKKNPPQAYQRCSLDAEWHFIAEVLGYTPLLLDAHPNQPQAIPVAPQPNITMPRVIVGNGPTLMPGAPRYTVNPAGTIISNDGEKP